MCLCILRCRIPETNGDEKKLNVEDEPMSYGLKRQAKGSTVVVAIREHVQLFVNWPLALPRPTRVM